MKPTYRRDGNLLTEDAEALVNTVNCQGFMGKGIALEFKRAFKENFRQYKVACERGQLRPGKMLIYPVAESLPGLSAPRFIINFPTKDRWRAKSRLEYIEAGLLDLRATIVELGIKSIAVPPLGCGHGGLSWSDVKPLIEEHLGSLEGVAVVVYEPREEASGT
jgi:O-acetyl-ADP-ribose deacetylase (regulator of RNase III)